MKNYKSAKITSIIFAFIILSLVINIVYLGATGTHLISGEDIAGFAKNRSKKEIVQYAQRGQIYSSDGETIATNVKKYKIILTTDKERISTGNKKAYVTDAAKTAQLIGPVLGIDVGELTTIIQKALDDDSVKQKELGTKGKNLTTAVKKQIESFDLPGIEFIESNARYYPLGDFCSYTVGYAKSYDDTSVKKMVGEMGLELAYDKELKGKNGYKVYQTDAKGYELVDGVLREKDPVDGNDLYLTINSGLQRNLDYLLAKLVTDTKGELASCAVMEVKTGKILAMSTYPSFNPNERNINTFSNYFLNGTLECGSVFKPFIYATSIEEGKYSHEATYQSGSYNVYYGNVLAATVRDHNQGRGWGTITYDEGLYRSSNVAICNLLDKGYVTKDVLSQKLDDLGFYQSDTMDGLKCSSSINAYKRDAANRLEYLTTGFGQGSTVTPYQLLKAYSVFGNDGKTVKPYIVDKIVDPSQNKVVYQGKTEYSQQIFSSDTVKQVKDLMLGVIENPAGTGKSFKMDDIRMYGKTGTGQIVVDGAYSSSIHMHSFAGLAPYDDPQVLMFLTVKCDETYSLYASDFVKKIMKESIQVVNQYNVKNENTIDEGYTLDSYMNQSVSYVKSKLEAKSFQVHVIGNGDTVIEQYPSARSRVIKGDKVFIKTNGTEITLPDMLGWSKKEAQSYASLSGLKIIIQGTSGHVQNQSVASGSVVHSGDEVTITLS